ncbi:unnamed protein product [Adineta steineri]|uniref:SH2 domain-containing protein n=2 Tax=Adineta steineri TaxID=433720 RepID=A0A814Z280_9BILA|nr:unnamed protein product [Adineta steineri]CAF1597600.1 unnamed protein product [Adineta steineri]
MGTLKTIFKKLSGDTKTLYEYETYSYKDIQSQWIIYQDNLHYLCNTNVLGQSVFKIYRVVLVRMPVENMEDIIGLYLFPDEKKSSSNFFSINKKTIINNRCNKTITPIPKCFLFELKFIDKENAEIFGAKDDPTRTIWVNMLENLVLKLKLPPADPVLGYLTPIPIEESRDKPSSSLKQGTNGCNINKQEIFNSSRSQSNPDMSPYSVVDPVHHSRSSVPLKSNNDIHIQQNKKMLWNDIYYSNENNDYRSVITKTGEYGTFLIRPQSKKTNSNDHNYTLCLYHNSSDVRCFRIEEFPGNRYGLSKKDNRKFVDIIQLCQYYTTHELPMDIRNVYLKKPYKYNEHENYYIE